MTYFLRVSTCLSLSILCFSIIFTDKSHSIEHPSITFATGSRSGTYYPIGEGIAEAAKKYGLDIEIKETEGSRSNIKLLKSREARLALVQSDVLYYAFTGIRPYTEAHSSLRALASLYTEVVHVLFRSSLHITEITDLRGKKVSIGPKGSGTEPNAIAILEAAGVTLDEIVALNISLEESVAAMKDGSIDVAFVMAGVPTEAIKVAMSNGIIRILPIRSNLLKRLTRNYPYLLATVIPRNSYGNQQKEISAIGVKAILVANEDIDDSIIYSITTTLFNEKELLVAKHPRANAIEVDSALKGIPIPLHDGAENFYIDSGLYTKRFFKKIANASVWVVLLVAIIVFYLRFRTIKRYFKDREPELILLIVIIIWILGSAGLYVFEHNVNENFDSLAKSFWSTIVYLISGFENKEPITPYGQVVAILILAVGAGLVAFVTAAIAAVFIERKITGGKRKMSKMKDHFVILNWNNKGYKLIEELHSSDVENKRDIVVISDSVERINFPEKKEYDNVLLIKGDTTNDKILLSSNVQYAFSVIILADESLSEQADGKSILCILNIRKICRQDNVKQIHVTVEIVDPQKVELAKHAGAEDGGLIEIVSSSNLGLMMLSQASVTPGLTKVYDELLTFGKGSNEIYRVKIPNQFNGKGKFNAFLDWALTQRVKDKFSFMPIGIARENEIILNPKSDEELKENDYALVIADSPPKWG